MTMNSKKRRLFEFIQRDEDKKELRELFHGDSDSGDDDLLVRAKRRQDKLDSGKKVFALVPADVRDDSEISDDSDREEDEQEGSEEEVLDAEKFKEQKTEIFREMANVKDIVEDFDLSEEEKVVEEKKRKPKGNTRKLQGKRRKGEEKPRKKQKVVK